MAFKILSEEQISRLTPLQQESYRAAYEEYREREAFVNRVERQRNIRVPEYKIKKRPIKQIRRPSSSQIKFDVFGVRLGEAGDKLFNTTKHASEQAERLGKRRQIARSDVHLPGVRVVKGRRIQAAAPKRGAPELSRVPVVKPSAKQFAFRQTRVSVGSVLCKEAPRFRRNKPAVKMTPLSGIVLAKVRRGEIQAPKRTQPVLPNITCFSAAAVQCRMETPKVKAAPSVQIKQPQIAAIAVPKQTVALTEKNIVTAPAVTIKERRPVAPVVKGTVSVVLARNITLDTGSIRISPVQKQQIVSAPIITANRGKQAPGVKALTPVAVAVVVRKDFKLKPPVLSYLPSVRIFKPKAVAAPEKSSEVFHADGKVLKIQGYPNRATIVVPVINQTAEVEKIIRTLGRLYEE